MISTRSIRLYIKPPLFAVCLWPVWWIGWHLLGSYLEFARPTSDFVLMLKHATTHSTLGANPTEAMQDEFGDWGLRFLLITLAVTPVKDWTGWNWLIPLRRMLGLFGFFYILAHFTVWIWLDQGFYWPGLLPEIIKRPFITLGMLALLMLIPLAITSTNKMMRRLGRRWKKLHRLIYPICILGCWHYYWQVKADIREPLIYFVIAFVLLGWRAWKHYRKAPVSREIPETEAPARAGSNSSR
jgi:sulfoxide reductase heme-binding subunit YedZ